MMFAIEKMCVCVCVKREKDGGVASQDLIGVLPRSNAKAASQSGALNSRQEHMQRFLPNRALLLPQIESFAQPLFEAHNAA